PKTSLPLYITTMVANYYTKPMLVERVLHPCGKVVSAVASAETATPDGENGRYSINPVADGVLRLDTCTGQVSQCSRSDVGWGLQGGAGRAFGTGDRDRSPAGREHEPEEGAFGPWAAGTRCFRSVRRKARRAGT